MSGRAALSTDIPCARVAKEEVPLTHSGSPSVQVHRVDDRQNLTLISYLYGWTRALAVVLINNEDDCNLPEELVKTASYDSDVPLFILKRADGDDLLRCLEEMPSLYCEIALVSNPDYQVSPLLSQKFHSKESKEKVQRLTGNLGEKSL